MKPGHYPTLSNADYHGGAGISKSHLDVVARGERVYWQNYRNPNRPAREEKAAWALGSVTHCAILEPDMLMKEFAVEPDEADGAPNRPTKAQLKAEKKSEKARESIDFWAEWDERMKGKQVVSQDHFSLALDMRDTVHKHPKAGPLLEQLRREGGQPEQSFYAIDPDTGLLVKCRFDFLAGRRALDLKTTRDASEDGFAGHVCDYRYHVQEAWYRKVFGLVDGNDFDDWTFLAVESEAPHQVGIYTLPRDVVRAARREAERNLRQIGDAIALDYWPDPGYAGSVELRIPRWGRAALGMDTAESDFDGLDN